MGGLCSAVQQRRRDSRQMQGVKKMQENVMLVNGERGAWDRPRGSECSLLDRRKRGAAALTGKHGRPAAASPRGHRSSRRLLAATAWQPPPARRAAPGAASLAAAAAARAGSSSSSGTPARWAAIRAAMAPGPEPRGLPAPGRAPPLGMGPAPLHPRARTPRAAAAAAARGARAAAASAAPGPARGRPCRYAFVNSIFVTKTRPLNWLGQRATGSGVISRRDLKERIPELFSICQSELMNTSYSISSWGQPSSWA
jgi:subtilisin family serine protease